MDRRTKDGRKSRLRLWLALILVPTALVLALFIYRWLGESELEKRLDALSAAGYPVTLAELDRWYATPPYGQNAAEYVGAAATYLKLPKPEEAERLPLYISGELPPRTEPLNDETLALIVELVDRNSQAIELLEDAAALPTRRYPVDLTQGHMTLLDHLGEFRKIVYLLSLKAISEAQRGQPDSATDTLITALGVVDTLAAEPILVSQTLRLAYQSIVVSTIEQVVNRTTLGQDDLIRLEAALDTAYDPNGLIRGFIGQQCMTIQLLRHPNELGFDLDPVVSNQGGPSLLQIRTAQITGRADRYLIEFIDLTERWLAAIHMPPDHRQREAESIAAKTQRLSKVHKMLGQFAPRFNPGFIANDVAVLAKLRAASTALAVERYRLANGTLPDRLDALAPAFLETVPEDPFDGQPLRYKKLDMGFVVYSIGKDRSDDDGREPPPRDKRSHPPAPSDITFTVER